MELRCNSDAKKRRWQLAFRSGAGPWPSGVPMPMLCGPGCTRTSPGQTDQGLMRRSSSYEAPAAAPSHISLFPSLNYSVSR